MSNPGGKETEKRAWKAKKDSVVTKGDREATRERDTASLVELANTRERRGK